MVWCDWLPILVAGIHAVSPVVTLTPIAVHTPTIVLAYMDNRLVCISLVLWLPSPALLFGPHWLHQHGLGMQAASQMQTPATDERAMYTQPPLP